ncbi:MAG TPA: AAA family ATPase [Wenzhouxiangella sp.]
MYESFYSLSERPFSITPNPRFVYLSRRHQDALAHLLYGVGTGGSGGFVQLTGEVGTGKTTLCRLVLEQVPEKTRIALILNPMLGPLELLEAICDELEIDWASHKGSGILRIHGALNQFLLDRHAAGERVVLIIDEAQNLSEAALEQVRLLTNLETATDKLLQIILIGQPELRDLLRQTSLRQLAQRITARYHLDPLDLAETIEYVKHRLLVADSPRCPFNQKALEAIHETSGGVPRLINIIADRALLAGYASEMEHIDSATVRAAALEVSGEDDKVRASKLRGGLAFSGVALLVALGLGLAWALSTIDASKDDVVRPVWQEILITNTAHSGWEDGASLWSGVRPEAVESACESEPIVVSGLACLPLRGTWRYVEEVGMPVLLVLHDTGQRHVLLIGLSEDTAVVRHQGQDHEIAKGQLERFWRGEFLVIWPDQGRVWQRGDAGSGVAEAKLLAQKSTPNPWRGGLDEAYDEAFQEWVVSFQTRQALANDGVIGPATRLFLRYPHERLNAQALLPLELVRE